MDRQAFFRAFTEVLDKILARFSNVSQQARADFTNLRNDTTFVQMRTRGTQLLNRIVQEAGLATVKCVYEIDGVTFCTDLPDELCARAGGTHVLDCPPGSNPDWSSAFA
jgi:hypothetical protein